MTSLRALPLAALAGLSPLMASGALAQQDSYYYGGVAAGRARAALDSARIQSDLSDLGLTTTSLTRDRSDTGYKLFGGYQWNRHFALELGYFDLGRSAFSAATSPAGTLDGSFKVHGVNMDLVGTLPVAERLSILGRVGVIRSRTRADFSGTGAVVVTDTSRSDSDTRYKAGLGLQYAFSPGFLMRTEFERYRVSDTMGRRGNVNLVSASLVFPFGRSAAPMPRAMAPTYAPDPVPAAAPVVAQAPLPPVAAEPAPVIVPVAAPPAVRRVSYSAESLFAFDRSTLQPEGRSALDALVAEIAGAQYELISVEGHTDRIGSTAYNQQLSLERAEAVKAYLVATGRLPAAKITTVGKGESMPVTQAADCKGSGQGAAIVACLQPDRRVEIEIVGTR